MCDSHGDELPGTYPEGHFLSREDYGKAKYHVREILRLIGEDPDREGILETPHRVVKSWIELFAGYRQDPKDLLKVFKEKDADEMVICKNIEFFSNCEHHWAVIQGHCSIAYVPKDGRVIGLSKLPRLLDIFARRFQIQESLTAQVANTLQEVLEPLGVAVHIDAKHYCVQTRGVKKQDSSMVTTKLLGCFRDDPSCRNEFFQSIK